MFIKTKLYLSFGAAFLVVLIVMLLVVFLNIKTARYSHLHQDAMDIQGSLSELALLTNEYIVFPEQRIVDQWHLKYEATRALFHKDEVLNDVVHDNFHDLEEVFSQMVSISFSIDQAGDELEASELTAVRDRLVSQAIVETHAMIESVVDYSLNMRSLESEANRLARTISLIGLITVLVVIFVTLLLIYRSLIVSVNRLYDGVKAIKEGDFDYKIEVDHHDELGLISLGFNNMAKDLKNNYRNLSSQIKQRTAKANATLRILEEEKNKLQILLDNISDGIVLLDPKMRILLFNKAAQDITGYQEADVLNEKYEDKFSFETDKGKDAAKIVRNAVAKGKGVGMKDGVVLVTGNEKTFPVAFTSQALKGYRDKSLGYAIVFRDITLEKQVDDMKTDFVSVTSHQLKTPLTFLRWATDSLVDSLKAGQVRMPKSKREILDDLRKKVTEMNDLVNTLLNISRMETGRLSVEPEPHSLAKIIGSIIKEVKRTAEQKGVQVTFVKPIEDIPPVKVDKVLITQVVKNFLTNAIKYTPDKNGYVSVILEEAEGGYNICVEDNGIGIPKDKQKEIFNKYFREDRAREMSPEGSGLGLYVAKMIMEISGGRVWFTSTKGKGSNFCLFIPRQGMKAKKGEKGLAV